MAGPSRAADTAEPGGAPRGNAVRPRWRLSTFGSAASTSSWRNDPGTGREATPGKVPVRAAEAPSAFKRACRPRGPRGGTLALPAARWLPASVPEDASTCRVPRRRLAPDEGTAVSADPASAPMAATGDGFTARPGPVLPALGAIASSATGSAGPSGTASMAGGLLRPTRSARGRSDVRRALGVAAAGPASRSWRRLMPSPEGAAAPRLGSGPAATPCSPGPEPGFTVPSGVVTASPGIPVGGRRRPPVVGLAAGAASGACTGAVVATTSGEVAATAGFWLRLPRRLRPSATAGAASSSVVRGPDGPPAGSSGVARSANDCTAPPEMPGRLARAALRRCPGSFAGKAVSWESFATSGASPPPPTLFPPAILTMASPSTPSGLRARPSGCPRACASSQRGRFRVSRPTTYQKADVVATKSEGVG